MTHIAPPKGPMRTAAEVARDHFFDKVKPEWVLRHVRPRIQLSRTKVFFYDEDVVAWIARRAQEEAA